MTLGLLCLQFDVQFNLTFQLYKIDSRNNEYRCRVICVDFFYTYDDESLTLTKDSFWRCIGLTINCQGFFRILFVYFSHHSTNSWNIKHSFYMIYCDTHTSIKLALRGRDGRGIFSVLYRSPKKKSSVERYFYKKWSNFNAKIYDGIFLYMIKMYSLKIIF